MKGETMLATMQRLGVAYTRSRPSVSNDNPDVESAFRTLKYRPQLPVKPFENLLAARRWVTELAHWYNHESCVRRTLTLVLHLECPVLLYGLVTPLLPNIRRLHGKPRNPRRNHSGR